MIYDELDQVIKISDKKYPKKCVNPKNHLSRWSAHTVHIHTIWVWDTHGEHISYKNQIQNIITKNESFWMITYLCGHKSSWLQERKHICVQTDTNCVQQM